jgi:hypothetical protein
MLKHYRPEKVAQDSSHTISDAEHSTEESLTREPGQRWMVLQIQNHFWEGESVSLRLNKSRRPEEVSWKANYGVASPRTLAHFLVGEIQRKENGCS